MVQAGLLFYLTVKLAAYAAVCYAGLRRPGGALRNQMAAAITLGICRLLLGVGLGLVIYLASTSVYAAMPDELPRGIATYLAVYVPVRWLEWSLFAVFIFPPARSLAGFLIGSGTGDRLWRCLGIAVSCLADIPVMWSIGGLPVGRFFC